MKQEKAIAWNGVVEAEEAGAGEKSVSLYESFSPFRGRGTRTHVKGETRGGNSGQLWSRSQTL